MTALLSAAHLGKEYVLRSEQSFLMSVARRRRPRRLWALRDLSMEVLGGEVVAVVGRNGAGKSTLLKLAAGVTTPTTGTLRRPQRIAPLIEVGAGFHPELSGRENIEVNAQLLGIGRARLRSIFDDIVEFAELAHAIDQPVKEYSSGMYMRLGFAVAVHTQPELLVVDEVLAVGDMPFQVRCLDRIREMRAAGAGVLFVSHNLSAVLELADRALFLEKGEVRAEGDPRAVLGAYQTSLQHADRSQDEGLVLDQALTAGLISVTAADGSAPLIWNPGQRARARVRLRASAPVSGVLIGLQLHREGTGLVAGWHEPVGGDHGGELRPGSDTFIDIDLALNVVPGQYSLDLFFASPDLAAMHAELVGAIEFAVVGPAVSGLVDVAPRIVRAEPAAAYASPDASRSQSSGAM